MLHNGMNNQLKLRAKTKTKSKLLKSSFLNIKSRLRWCFSTYVATIEITCSSRIFIFAKTAGFVIDFVIYTFSSGESKGLKILADFWIAIVFVGESLVVSSTFETSI